MTLVEQDSPKLVKKILQRKESLKERFIYQGKKEKDDGQEGA
jgi:hypothetical protein